MGVTNTILAAEILHNKCSSSSIVFEERHINSLNFLLSLLPIYLTHPYNSSGITLYERLRHLVCATFYTFKLRLPIFRLYLYHGCSRQS